MDAMNEMQANDDRRHTDALRNAEVMGEIRSDVKHILDAIKEFKGEVEQVETRIGAVEKFNTRILGMAAVAIPAMTVIVNIVVSKLNINFGG